MSEWQPIETAPRDFTPILLWWIAPYGKPSVQLARWCCRTHVFSSIGHVDCPNEPDCDEGWDNLAGRVTHWMPLPDAPKEAK